MSQFKSAQVNILIFVFNLVSDTECTKEQLAYNKAKTDGTLGQFMFRPECDEDGFYKSVKCIPGQM